MEKEIKRISPVVNLESTVYTLLAAKACGQSVFCDFDYNGKHYILYSDTVSMDSAFKEVMGETKESFKSEIKEIPIRGGDTIESAVYTLLAAKARGQSVYCEFNSIYHKRHKLYSDTVSMDSAYMEITGRTKADNDKALEEYYKGREVVKKENRERMKANFLNWIKIGETLIFPERCAEWEKYVVDQFSGSCSKYADPYYTITLFDCGLKIMTALENGASIEEAKKIFYDECDKDSMDEVRTTVLRFSSKGPEFWEATADEEISLEDKQMLEAKRQENEQLIQANKQKRGPKL